MKRSPRIRKLIFCFVLILFFNPLSFTFAQSGAWIEQVLQPTMSGNWLADRGENCLAYTKENSQYIYFFDINVSQWTEVDLGTPQTFRDVEASGHTAMAYTDDVIIGYSATTSQWDTLHYQGTLLYPTGSGISRGYGCGDKLAYFVTDTYFYVFDSELGAWQSHSYLYPGASPSGNFWSGDDYAGAILNQNPPNYPVNMVYSLPQHAFNENLQGGFYYHNSWGMTHGFVTTWGDGVNTYIMNGYSSHTNQFIARTILSSPGNYHGGGCTWPENLVDKTVAVFHNMETPSEARLFAYDTRQGQWYEASHYFDPQYYSSTGGWGYGGRVAGTAHHHIQTRVNTYLLFDGASGSFNTLSPGILWTQSGAIPGFPIPAGNFVMAHDTANVWFYNPANQNSHFISMPWQAVTGVYAGDNFATIGSYGTPGAPVEMHIFNATTDQLTDISIGSSPNITVVGSPYVCGFAAGTGYSEVYFYSGLLDAFTYISYPPNSYAGVHVRNHLAVASIGSQSHLYDATTNSVYAGSFIFNSNGIGEEVAIFKRNGSAIDAYSTRFQQFTEFPIPEGVYGVTAGGNVGLVSSPGYSKFYAYNGFYHSLVPLQPSGMWQGSMVGTNTALVVRVDRVYAFDPQALTGFAPDHPRLGDFHLAQNYPNPFNPETKIKYQISNTNFITLKVYDLLGQEVASLVNELKTPGTYSVQLDASDLASGVYMYRLQAGSFVDVKKMIVLR